MVLALTAWILVQLSLLFVTVAVFIFGIQHIMERTFLAIVCIISSVAMMTVVIESAIKVLGGL